MACLNPKFADELQAINTIYSQNTLRVRRTLSDGRLEILFRLPAPLPQDQLTFHLLFPADYPDCDQSPQYLHADVGLYESQDRRLQNISLFVAICLEWVFVKGDVCVFDLVDVVLGFVGCLDVENNTENGGGQSKDRPGHGINVEKLEALGPQFSNCDWRWTRKSFINMNEARKQIECFICCDEDFAFRMIRTACQHWYCFDCFQSKLMWFESMIVNEANTLRFSGLGRCCQGKRSLHMLQPANPRRYHSELYDGHQGGMR